MSTLVVENLRVGYRDSRGPAGQRRLVAEGISFNAENGCTALVGDNGTGKTSILLGICDAPRRLGGTVLLDGQALRPGEVGYAPQSAALTVSPWLTVREECLLARRISGEHESTSQEALVRLLRELGLQLPLERRVGETSGGQRVLIAIVRALLVPRAKIYVLDEPYEGLSAGVREVVTRVLNTVAVNRPVLITSHRVEDLLRLNARVFRLVGRPARSVERVTIDASVPWNEPPTGGEPELDALDSATPKVERRRGAGLVRLGQGLLGVAAGFLLWQLAALAIGRSGLLPKPTDVFAAAWQMVGDPELRRSFLATIGRAIGSWVGGLVLAVPVGIALGYSALVYRLCAPWVSVARCVPVFALSGTAIGLFPGLPEIQRLFLIAGMVWLVALQIVSHGTSVAPKRRLDFARVLGAGAWFRIRNVLLPEVSHSVLSAAETTLPIAMIVTFVVETTLLPRRFGLGPFVFNHLTDPDLSTVWAYLLLPAIIAAAGVMVIRMLGGRFVREL